MDQVYFSERGLRYRTDTEFRNKIGKCELCGQNIKDRTVVIYQGLIDALYKVYKYCGKEQVHEFEMKDIRHLLGRNEYARFGDLVRFGGLVYRPESRKGLFGLNMARTKEFFYGLRKIPISITLNQLTGEIIDSHYVSIGDFPELKDLLTKDGLYDPEEAAKLSESRQTDIFDFVNEQKSNVQ